MEVDRRGYVLRPALQCLIRFPEHGNLYMSVHFRFCLERDLILTRITPYVDRIGMSMFWSTSFIMHMMLK